MKNNRIVRSYDTINPSPGEKQRMLDAILAQADLEEKPERSGKRRETPVHTAKATKSSRRSILGGLAACLAVFVISGAVLLRPGDSPDGPGYVEPTGTVAYEQTAQDHYTPVLDKYRRAVREGWTREQCEIEGISLRMQAGADLTRTGYAFLDLDGDSREELIIAQEALPHIDHIWDIYTTLEDGTPIQLWVDECDGNQCYLYQGNIIGTEYTTKDAGEYGYYTLQSGQLVMREMLQFEDEDTAVYTDAAGNTCPLTGKEAMAIGDGYDHKKLSLTWLAEIPESLGDTKAAEAYTPVLEKYRTALAEKWTSEQCEENEISVHLSSPILGLGWCILDLDGNGREELIISDGTVLYDLYSLDAVSGTPVHILSYRASENYTLCRDGRIEVQVFNTHSTDWKLFRLQGQVLQLSDMLRYCYDQQNDQGASGYFRGSSEADLQPISKEEAGEIIVMGSRPMELELTPFAWIYGENPQQVYETIIDLHATALAEKWDGFACMEKGLSISVAAFGDHPGDLGYTILDLDGNGTQELMITSGNSVYSLYTITREAGCGAVTVFNGAERSHYSITEDGLIFHDGSGGAAIGYDTFYRLEGSRLIFVEGYMFDADTDPENPWFFYDGRERLDPCGSFDAQAAIAAHKIRELSFTPFQ